MSNHQIVLPTADQIAAWALPTAKATRPCVWIAKTYKLALTSTPWALGQCVANSGAKWFGLDFAPAGRITIPDFLTGQTVIIDPPCQCRLVVHHTTPMLLLVKPGPGDLVIRVPLSLGWGSASDASTLNDLLGPGLRFTASKRPRSCKPGTPAPMTAYITAALEA